MINQKNSDHLTTRSHRLVYIISILLIIIVALRRRYDLEDGFSLVWMLILLGVFLTLFLSEPLISRKLKSYHLVYLLFQLIIVQILGVFRSYQDTWALLYIVLGFQVAVRCSSKEAMVWYGLFGASLLVTLAIEFGLISGPGRAMAYIVMGVLLISYDIQYAKHEDALDESQMLVKEVKEAHQKLVEYTAQAEKLAALQQRSLMLQELYDSVGQKVFAIQLAAESTRLLLTTDHRRAIDQINALQEQTQSTLRQMRQLIDQWRPA